MKTMAVSEFKAKALAVVEEVRTSGEPVLITKRGEPAAELVPAASQNQRKLGAMAGTVEIKGDIISPVVDPSEWAAISGDPDQYDPD